MNISATFIRRPVGTTLLTVAIALAGALGYVLLPVSPLPQVEYPTISVSAALPGASPETMASSVATPLERQFGRIAGINEMTSTSYLGTTSITMQFDLNRDIDGAARDVQAAINAAAGQLPANLPTKPNYRKVNPADSPVLILALTSEIYDKAHMYDAASSILAQKLSQMNGVGQVVVGGGALPAVRVDVNPTVLNNMGLGLEDVRTAIAGANANRPKGQVQNLTTVWSIGATDQLLEAATYRPLLIAYRNGAAVRLSDVARVSDSVEDIRTTGNFEGKPAIILIIFRQPGANIISTTDNVLAALPQLQAEIPAGMKLAVGMDRTLTIRASVHDVEGTLLVSISLVILVVFLFLRNVRATIIPSVVVPVSLIGTFGVMYLLNYSLDNLSLMALTVATGFVVDDAIVVIENITRHIEAGMRPVQAALLGAREIGFTVLSISISLVAVFIPILLMGGYVGRLFREFAVTLSVAILVSLVVSLTTTPMMCATLLRPKAQERHGRVYLWSEAVFQWILARYESSLAWVLRHQFVMILVTLGTIGWTVYLYVKVPKGFFPEQDAGRLGGQIIADQSTSYQALSRLLTQYASIVRKDPGVSTVLGSTGGTRGTTNTGSLYISLKSRSDRKDSAEQIIARLRPKLAAIPGATVYLQAYQDVKITAHSSRAEFQYTIEDENLQELVDWSPRILEKLTTLHGLVDVNSDQQNHGLQASLVIDRATAARFGITPRLIDNTLYDAFGQRQVSTIYTALNQYHVVMEADPVFWQDPDGLKHIYIKASDGKQIPLSAFTHYAPSTAALAVNHQGQFPSVTISFNLLPGISLGDAVEQIEAAEREMNLPATIHGSFQGTAQAFQVALSNEPILILAALGAVYIVLGILYESYIHPITILSTIPSAGVGALLALMLCHMELNVLGTIGIILLIGIVKKNAIMMIDFALEAERGENLRPKEAIYRACLLRFRPIIMTTMAALLGGLPLALGTGVGSEMRRPLGIAIVGGLIFSQMLTLYTTPVVYLYMDRFRLWLGQYRHDQSNRPLEISPA